MCVVHHIGSDGSSAQVVTPFDLFKNCGDAPHRWLFLSNNAGAGFSPPFYSFLFCFQFLLMLLVLSVNCSFAVLFGLCFCFCGCCMSGFDLNRNQIGYQKDAEASKLGTLSACVRSPLTACMRWISAEGPGKNQ